MARSSACAAPSRTSPTQRAEEALRESKDALPPAGGAQRRHHRPSRSRRHGALLQTRRTTASSSSPDWRKSIQVDLPGVEGARGQLRGESTTIEYRHRAKDGSWVWLETKCPVVLGPDGKPHQRVLASRDITEAKRAEDLLRTRWPRRKSCSKEIHHRVKNNMQVISSLVALQADRLPDAAMRSVLQDVTHRVRSMALVHEKLYQSANMAQVEFAEYARKSRELPLAGPRDYGVRRPAGPGPGAGAAFGQCGGAVRADPERAGQ